MQYSGTVSRVDDYVYSQINKAFLSRTENQRQASLEAVRLRVQVRDILDLAT